MKIKFSYIILLLALSVAGCAGYFSVWGLSQLFAGASTAVIIMASFLEVGKVVATTALHRYWDRLAKGLKFYLTTSVFILMMITSAGIYGFLSNAYQKTANKLELQEGEVSLLETKKSLFQKNIDDNQKIIDSKNERFEQLNNLRLTQEARFDSATSYWRENKIRADIKIATDEIQKISSDIDVLNVKNQELSDSIAKYSLKVLDVNTKSEISGEIGPLKYISELTGKPMSKVVNFLILLLIFVFDPLAIALILMTNRVFELEKMETNNVVSKEPTLELEPVVEPEFELPIPEPTIELEHKSSLPIPEPEPVLEPELELPIPESIVEVEPESELELPIPEKQARKPVIPTGKIEIEDIEGIKEAKRGFSVNVPRPKNNNNIERI